MRLNVNETHITNTLSYIHLLPLNEQIKHIDKILHYINTDSRRNDYSTGCAKLLKEAIKLIDKIRIFFIDFTHNSRRMRGFKGIEANISTFTYALFITYFIHMLIFLLILHT